MSFIKALMNFLKKLFGGSTTTVQSSTQTVTQPTVTTNPIHPSVGIIDPVEFSFYFGKYSVEDQIKIRNTIDENAAKGIKNYSIDMPDRTFNVIDGTKIYESTEGKFKTPAE